MGMIAERYYSTALAPRPSGLWQSGKVSLRTLVLVRWIVIIGQLVTVSVVAVGI
jgi:hypothetical protein